MRGISEHRATGCCAANDEHAATTGNNKEMLHRMVSGERYARGFINTSRTCPGIQASIIRARIKLATSRQAPLPRLRPGSSMQTLVFGNRMPPALEGFQEDAGVMAGGVARPSWCVSLSLPPVHTYCTVSCMGYNRFVYNFSSPPSRSRCPYTCSIVDVVPSSNSAGVASAKLEGGCCHFMSSKESNLAADCLCVIVMERTLSHVVGEYFTRAVSTVVHLDTPPAPHSIMSVPVTTTIYGMQQIGKRPFAGLRSATVIHTTCSRRGVRKK